MKAVWRAALLNKKQHQCSLVNGNDCYAASSWKKSPHFLLRNLPAVSEAAHFRGEHVHNNKRIENNAATGRRRRRLIWNHYMRGIMKWGDGQKRLAIFMRPLLLGIPQSQMNFFDALMKESTSFAESARKKWHRHTIVYSFCVDLILPSAVFGTNAFILMRAAW